MVEHLTKSELAIMEVMWDQEDALTATEIIKVSGAFLHFPLICIIYLIFTPFPIPFVFKNF